MRLQALSDALNPISPIANLSLSSPHRVLVVGCAYGGISAVVNLIDLAAGKARDTVYPGPDLKGKRSRTGVEITVIDERDGYFHSVGAPLAHTTTQHTSLMWRRFNRLNELRHPNLSFKHGTVTSINPASKVAEWKDRSGALQRQNYDYVIVATGLKRVWPAVPKSGSFEEYVREGHELINKITGPDPTTLKDGERKVVIIGAGAVGVEFAGEIKNYYPSISVTLVHSRADVLSSEPLPVEVKHKVKELLIEEGVDLALGNRASYEQLPSGKYQVTLANNTIISADLVLDTTKKGSPTTGFLPEECLTKEDKEIKILPNLTFDSEIENKESHFGVGDVVAWSGIKRAGGAMVMGQVAATNVYASILNLEALSDSASDSGSENSASESTNSSSSDAYKLQELPHYNNVIGLAVGKQCLTYDKDSGVKFGVELMKSYFGDDLGWKANLKYLNLTDVIDEPRKEEMPEKVQMAEVGVEPLNAAA